MKVKTTTDGCKIFKCPGCKGYHVLPMRGTSTGRPSWEYNGDPVKPTFQPSILSRRWRNGEDKPPDVCHSWVRDGKIEFLNDCTHHLTGKTVEIPDWPHAP